MITREPLGVGATITPWHFQAPVFLLADISSQASAGMADTKVPRNDRKLNIGA